MYVVKISFLFLQNLTDANEMLQQRCDDLQKNLEDAVQQMDRTTEDYVKLKVLYVCVCVGSGWRLILGSMHIFRIFSVVLPMWTVLTQT